MTGVIDLLLKLGELFVRGVEALADAAPTLYTQDELTKMSQLIDLVETGHKAVERLRANRGL